ncbi:MAG: hypothetical protein ACTSO3_10725 [Candidatus Heimdallarchaeaceae archaeon]
MNLLEKVFKISQYLKDGNYNVQNQEFHQDPWTMEYIPELFISSEQVNSQIARLIKHLTDGNAICSIVGGQKSGKSYLMNILHDGLKEDLQRYIVHNKVHVLFFNPDNLKECSLTNYYIAIADQVLSRHFTLYEEVIVELKRYLEGNNSLLVVLLDNFHENNLTSIIKNTAKLLKPLKNHFSCVISNQIYKTKICSSGLEEGGMKHFSYTIRIPEVLSLEETKLLIQKRISYALNQTVASATDFFSERAIEAAWVESQGKPWQLISLLEDSYTYSKNQESKIVSHDDVLTVAKLFDRSTNQDGVEDHDNFAIRQALNNFPYRERQVCQYLMQKDASAKEITIYLYGKLPSNEYRSKYMGTKSFLKRLKDKNVVVVKKQSGRSLIFGLNPKMKAMFSQGSDERDSALTAESKVET